MVIRKGTIERIRRVIDRHYKSLGLSLLGRRNIPQEVLNDLASMGVDTTQSESIPEMLYVHNYLNKEGEASPSSLEEMRAQQIGSGPDGEAHDTSIEHLNANFYHLLEKHKTDMMSRFEGLMRDANNDYKFDALQNLDRPEDLDNVVKNTTLGQLKAQLRDLTLDANRNWERVVVTETSNAIGLGSVDRIVVDNREKDLDEVYVYRIVVQDAALCKYCRRFYLDGDGSPKVYRLTTLLSNGSNYGKKAVDWRPIVLATHPNERCSATLELKPGWAVTAGGSATYIGMDKWADYISNKVQ